jgi:signal transduction histidine kinase
VSLTRKLVIGFLAVSLVGAILAFFFARWMTIQEFNRLVIEQSKSAFIERAASYYVDHGSWQGIAIHFRQSSHPPYMREPRLNTGKAPYQEIFAFTLADQDGVVVVPGGSYKMRVRIPEEILAQGEPVKVNDEIVGTVIASGKPLRLAPQEERYLERTNRALFYAAGSAALVALVLGLLLARGLTGPLRELTEAIRTLTKGELGRQVAVRSQDEIGELATAFNLMSTELERLLAQRQQMTADIAHDLRTPLTVISGYVESIQDGVLEATPERLETIYNEVKFLQRLVEDLRTLSLAETGQLTLNLDWIAPQTFLEQLHAAYLHTAAQKRIEFVLQVSPDLPDINVDPDRMMQVLSNLVSNALRHTHPGGKITILSSMSNQPAVMDAELAIDRWLQITITDTGEGIDPQVLPYIFDRSYRADHARPENKGESGLGLTIAHSIILMHRGELSADSDGLGKGTTFKIRLPLVNNPENHQEM